MILATHNILRKSIAWALVMALLLACCSSAFATAEAAEPITIKFWNSFTGADGNQLVDLVNRFNQSNMYGITVEMDISSNFSDQLTSALAAGTGPALVLMSNAMRYQFDGYLQDMSDVFEKTGLDQSDFIQSYLDYCKDGDAMYLVPFQIVGFYLFWNKDLFTAAGLDPEKAPATWAEYAEFAAKLTDASKNVYGSGLCYNYAYQLAHVIQRFGGLAVTQQDGKWQANFAGNAGYAKFLTSFKAMLDSGANPLEADTDPMMTAGQIAMTVSGPWITGGLDTAGINYGIALLPQDDAGDMNSVEVLGFGVPTVATEAEKLAAYRFIQWWNTQDAQGSSPALEWATQNGFPAYTYSVQAQESYQSSLKLRITSSANPEAPTDFFVDSRFPDTGSLLMDVLAPMVQSVVFDNTDVNAALEAAQKTADSIVAAFNQ
jgi:multiple sugar transport system substrate-binding protein